MTADTIEQALADIAAERDPTLKHLKLASLVSAVFRERGIELVVVGGSAIEFYTEGAYVSGDLDLCLVSPPRLDLRTRQELMGQLGATGGPRNWQVAGQYVDILGQVETLAHTPFDQLQAPFGPVRLLSPEDLGAGSDHANLLVVKCAGPCARAGSPLAFFLRAISRV